MRKSIIFIGLSALISFLPCSTFAEQFENFGEYTVHYNAFTTDQLESSVAKSFGIKRSKKRALLNISVLKKSMGTTGSPVKAKVSGKAVNLSNQLKHLDIRELQESGAIYYVAEIPVSNEETLIFTLSVSPEGSDATFPVQFQQQFFTK
jgi:hypothetical protein